MPANFFNQNGVLRELRMLTSTKLLWHLRVQNFRSQPGFIGLVRPVSQSGSSSYGASLGTIRGSKKADCAAIVLQCSPAICLITDSAQHALSCVCTAITMTLTSVWDFKLAPSLTVTFRLCSTTRDWVQRSFSKTGCKYKQFTVHLPVFFHIYIYTSAITNYIFKSVVQKSAIPMTIKWIWLLNSFPYRSSYFQHFAFILWIHCLMSSIRSRCYYSQGEKRYIVP